MVFLEYGEENGCLLCKREGDRHDKGGNQISPDTTNTTKYNISQKTLEARAEEEQSGDIRQV